MSKIFCIFRSSLPCALNSGTPLKSCSRTLYCSQIRLDRNGEDKKDKSETVNDEIRRDENDDDNEEARQKLLTTLRSSTSNDLVDKASNIETSSPDGETQDSEVDRSSDAERREKTKQKLNDLLRTMTKVPTEKIPDVKLPRPRVEAQKKYHKMKAEFIKRKEEIEKEKIDYQIEKAASEVAEKLGGDTKRTEKELLDLYLSRRTPQEIQSPIGESEEEKPFTNMKDLLLSLKVEKEKPNQQSRKRRAPFKKETKVVTIPSIPLSRARSKGSSKVDIFGAKPLNIFTTDQESKKGPPVESVMWDFLQERDLKLSVTKPPANIYEQLILWTEQGKIWRFPINNEQDWEEENVDFTEHVFLEHMLEPWCPPSGLIRHFMELVCVGLSKNPYLSVKEKHAHIIFYEHYFRHKNNLLVDLGLEPIKDRPQLEQAAV